MRDLIPPAIARHPAEAVELVTVAISDGDLEAALAQYERDAVLRPWQESSPAEAPVASQLSAVMDLRLPLGLAVTAVVPAGMLALVLAERRIRGAGPDCEHVDLLGSGAAIVRRQPGGGWRIAADAWCLAGTGVPSDSPQPPGEYP
jgi:ketosteroid isomerase-like protein